MTIYVSFLGLSNYRSSECCGQSSWKILETLRKMSGQQYHIIPTRLSLSFLHHPSPSRLPAWYTSGFRILFSTRWVLALGAFTSLCNGNHALRVCSNYFILAPQRGMHCSRCGFAISLVLLCSYVVSVVLCSKSMFTECIYFFTSFHGICFNNGQKLGLFSHLFMKWSFPMYLWSCSTEGF